MELEKKWTFFPRAKRRERETRRHVLVVRSTTLALASRERQTSLPDEKRCSSLELPKEEEFRRNDGGVDVNIQQHHGRKIKQTIRRAERPLQKFIQSPNPFRDGNGFVLRRRALVVRSFVR